MRPFKLDTVGRFSDMICEQTPREIVFGKADKHLTFHASLLCSEYLDGKQELWITTVVKYHNTLGRIYFFIIRPFHPVIVKLLLKRVAKAFGKTGANR